MTILRRTPVVLSTLAFAFALGGCTLGEVPRALNAEEKQELLTKRDWALARKVEVSLAERDINPNVIVLEQNEIYRVTIANPTEGGRGISASAFFASAAVRSIVAGGKVIEKTDLSSIDVDAGTAVDIYLVPGSVGSFDMEGSGMLDGMFGMVGRIIVRKNASPS